MRVEKKKTEACQSGPRARVPRQGDYSRPHQSQEIVKPTPNSVFFLAVLCLLFLKNKKMNLCLNLVVSKQYDGIPTGRKWEK